MVFSDTFDHFDFATGQEKSAAHTWYEGIWFSAQHTPGNHFQPLRPGLTLLWKRGQAQPDTSISTFSPFSRKYQAWRYGYFEARMKWNPVIGAWPAFWLIPVEAARANGPIESGEIDIFEGQGDEPKTFFGTIHRWHGSQQLESSSPRNHFSLPPNTDFAQFHDYGLLWTPGKVTWYFDGKPLHSEACRGIFDRQNYFVILGMQEGVAWQSGNLDGVSVDTMTLTVEWVRVWQSQENAAK